MFTLCTEYHYHYNGLSSCIYKYLNFYIIRSKFKIASRDSSSNLNLPKVYESYNDDINKDNTVFRNIAFDKLEEAVTFMHGGPCSIDRVMVDSVELSILDVPKDSNEEIFYHFVYSEFIAAISYLNTLKREYIDSLEDNLTMKENLSLSEFAKTCSTAELAEFMKSNPILTVGATELTKMNLLGDIISKSISSVLQTSLPNITDTLVSVVNKSKSTNEVDYIEPYKDDIRVIKRDSEEYNLALNDLDTILGEDDIPNIIEQLKTRGVCLSGKAGIGKGRIANNIGAGIIRNNSRYNNYATLFINCNESEIPAKVAGGTGMHNVEYLGGIYTACKYAANNPSTAVVIVFDELFDSDWKKYLGSSLELFSDKTKRTKRVVANGDCIYYEDNLYVVITGNTGVGFNRVIEDERFTTRFINMPITGLFHSEETLEKYISYMSTLSNDKQKLEDFAEVLHEVYEIISEDKKISTVVSLRRLNDIVMSCKSTDAFRKEVHSLFSPTDRKVFA